MKKNQHRAPLFQALQEFARKKPISFHVPGHKNGTIIPKNGKANFASLLPLDLTELSGLDDLHAPQGIIKEAQELAAAYFRADQTFFLVGGSTVGNLAMILAACSEGEKVLVQRNSHKSIMNGLELAGATPVFLAPVFERKVERYTAPSFNILEQALHEHSDAKVLILTYPDYFGKTYDIQKMITLAHEHNLVVLVDEAHGVHFSLGSPFPPSALDLGADVVVQSAHKMAPAMTMASYLHVRSNRIAIHQIAHYLQMLQSSSPSYPLLASLDLARQFLATMNRDKLKEILQSAAKLRRLFKQMEQWDVLPSDDPLKLTLHFKNGVNGYEAATLFEQAGIYPELATYNQLLFIHGLDAFASFSKLEQMLKEINDQLKSLPNHDTIETEMIFDQPVQQLSLPFAEMKKLSVTQVPLNQGIGCIAAEAITPYPPGIPFILKGEKITDNHLDVIGQLIKQGATIQHHDINKGIFVFNEAP